MDLFCFAGKTVRFFPANSVILKIYMHIFIERIEELGLDFILKYIESFGGMPVLGKKKGGNWNDSAYNLEDLMLLVRRETNTLPLVDIYVAQDDKNPTKHILAVNMFVNLKTNIRKSCPCNLYPLISYSYIQKLGFCKGILVFAYFCYKR